MGVRYAGGHQECKRPEEVMGKLAKWLVQMGSRSGRVQLGAGGHLLVEAGQTRAQKISGTQSEDISYGGNLT